MQKATVLIIDDSPTMCAILRAVLQRDEAIEVVGTAGDPYEAREAIKALSPDVITLDVNMPRMDGLEFLEKLMRLRPMPVVMISSLTSRNADLSIRALEMGAFDCVGKPTGEDFMVAMRGLPDIVKAAAKSGATAAAKSTPAVRDAPDPVPAAPTVVAAAQRLFSHSRLIVMGASTGGVDALRKILSGFPANCPPTLIAQHMPGDFITSFTKRLDRTCAPSIVVAEEGMPIRSGCVYIAPGDAHLTIAGRTALSCRLHHGAPVSGHKPSIDVLFDSAVAYGDRVVAALLTGMGSDGAEGLSSLREAGAHTVAQDEKTSIVFGMARAAKTLGAVERFLPLQHIGDVLLDACERRRKVA